MTDAPAPAPTTGPTDAPASGPETAPEAPNGPATTTDAPTGSSGPQNDPADDGADQDDTDHPDDTNDSPETYPAAVVKDLRTENAKLRVKGKRTDELTARLVAAIAAQTGRLADPTDLPVTKALLTDAGYPDADKIQSAIDALLERKPHLSSTRPKYSDIGQGPRGGRSDVNLADILRSGA